MKNKNFHEDLIVNWNLTHFTIDLTQGWHWKKKPANNFCLTLSHWRIDFFLHFKKKKFFLQESVKWIKIKPIQTGVEFYECNCISSCVTGFMSLDWHFHLPRNLGVNRKCLPLWLSSLEILLVVIYGSMKNVRENFILQLRSQRDQQKWTWIYGKKNRQTDRHRVSFW